jgi:hypothetical protein
VKTFSAAHVSDLELQMPHLVLGNISACVQVTTPDGRISRDQFAVTMLQKLDEDNEFLRKVTFSDETTHLGI